MGHRTHHINAVVLAVVLFLATEGREAGAASITPFQASPDQVLVIYNADWPNDGAGSSAGQDSREVAEYYVRMHTDPESGKRPHLLGLSCRHGDARHLNNWFIKEKSTDNANGLVFMGKGLPPDKRDGIRDSRKVEIHVSETDADWGSLVFKVRSEQSGQETLITPLRKGLQVAGIPATLSADSIYPPLEPDKGRSFRLNAADIYPGTVAVQFSVRDKDGKILRDLKLRYFDVRDFRVSQVGADGIPDDLMLAEDVLQPVRTFLQDPSRALADGTLLKDQILYLVVVHGMPYGAQGVWGIAHGVTNSWGEQGPLVSLEQRLQTVYYAWEKFRPPIVTLYQSNGPDAKQGVVNHSITTAMRNPLTGRRWNPYMHPDTYSYLNKPPKVPQLVDLPPLPQQRRRTDPGFFAYAVSRIDGATAEEAKRLVDYALYASRYLRPEMDCEVRNELWGFASKLTKLLSTSGDGLWGAQELTARGFAHKDSEGSQGVPLLVRPAGDGFGTCQGTGRDWLQTGFYPGGIERSVNSSNGLNKKDARVWKLLAQGVTVTAAGSPAGAGGPHITSTTFWDNRILLKYLFQGRDLGECFLRSTYHVNWSTSLIGDPLFHPDLNRTVMDTTPPKAAGGLKVLWQPDAGNTIATASVEIDASAENPEVALLKVTCASPDGKETVAVSPLYGRRPAVQLKGLHPGVTYTFKGEIMDPYGNCSLLPVMSSAAP